MERKSIDVKELNSVAGQTDGGNGKERKLSCETVWVQNFTPSRKPVQPRLPIPAWNADATKRINA